MAITAPSRRAFVVSEPDLRSYLDAASREATGMGLDQLSRAVAEGSVSRAGVVDDLIAGLDLVDRIKAGQRQSKHERRPPRS